tara:strand:- start:1386 stop:2228 length:843 start_codon:yes stop_codon:yes gene_type:complete
MDIIDLNLDNYELTDLLTLFKLEYDFIESDLKNAKKIVLKTHPDKSNLPKEYFLFFSKAYKIIYSIHEFRVKGKCSTEYMLDESTDVEIFKKLTGKKDFNKVFNELFDKCNIRTAEMDTGYGDWLRSDDDIDDTITTKENMHEAFREKKLIARDAIVNQLIQETSYNTYTDLLGNAPDNYSSDLFSSLGYEDLRNAHRENVIPVTEKDIKQTFKTQEELRIYRDSQNIIPSSLTESKGMLDKQKQQEIKQDTQRAYKLAKQDELYKDINSNFMSNLYKLT